MANFEGERTDSSLGVQHVSTASLRKHEFPAPWLAIWMRQRGMAPQLKIHCKHLGLK
jgi:hypothetical protein